MYFKNEVMQLKTELGERIVSGLNTVIHCHHYNALLQKTVENSRLIDGKRILKDAAAKTFARQTLNSLHHWDVKEADPSFDIVSELYSYLGFGILDFRHFSEHQIFSSRSHFVEGWKSGYRQEKRKICTFTEGFLEGAIFAALGEPYEVKEVACMNEGAQSCEFHLHRKKDSILEWDYTQPHRNEVDVIQIQKDLKSQELLTKVDLLAIQRTVFGMPLFGNDKGIIPAFNVYLAHMPRDFYNLVCLDFLAQMQKFDLHEIARDLLEEDAEACSLNTFAGIMHSEEWAALIEPMISQTEDNLYALIAVSNALGWGVTCVQKHNPYESLELKTTNGYEAIGAQELKGVIKSSDCPMLTGAASGLMSLVYGSGDFEGRKGAYKTAEVQCLSAGDPHCTFQTKIAEHVKMEAAS